MPPITINLPAGDNTITEGDSDYIVIEGVGNDGNNTLTFGNGNDQFILNNGNNTLSLGTGNDTITAGSGNNTITTTGKGTVTVTVTGGSNTISLGDGPDVLLVGDGATNVLTTGNGNSNITVGNGASDTLTVGTGSNTIALGSGAGDVVHTGSGNNTLSVSGVAVGGDIIQGALTSGDGTNNTLVLTTAGAINASGVSGFEFYQLANGGANSLTLTATNYARLPGNSISVLDGDSGNTVSVSALAVALSVGNGADTIFGTGSGTISGGTGTNNIDVTGQVAAGYVINSRGGVGTDTIKAGAGSDTINLTGTTTVGAFVQGIAGGALVINVGDGTDTVGGRRDTIAGANAASLNVNNTLGRNMFLRASDVGPTSVVDLSVATDTIRGGAGSLSATIGGTATVTGGATVTGKAALVVVGAGDASIVDYANGSEINAGYAGTGALNTTVSGSQVAVVAGDGGANVNISGGTLTGGASNVFVYGAGTAAGSALNVIDNGTADAVVAIGSAAFSVRAGGSGGAYFGGSATTKIDITGNNNLVETQYGTGGLVASVTGSNTGLVVGNSVSGGNIVIGAGSSNNLIFPTNTTASGAVNILDGGTGDLTNAAYGTGTVNVTISGSNDTVAAGVGTTNVTVGGPGPVVAFNFGGTLDFVGGSGSATVVGESWFGGSGGGTTVFGASGGSIAFTDGGGTGPVGALYYQAGAGNETLNASGSTTSDSLSAGPGNLTMTVGSGSAEILLMQSIIGGVGSVPGGAHDLVANFSGSGADSVDIGGGYASNSGAVAASGSSAILTLSDGTMVTFSNTTVATLQNAIHYS